ncbi:MAG: hypothetical protein DWC07_07050 [Candidatus Poseidoniales archaeon]|nr:MAG: hypothetical protein DWC07_07050 [Candidatus Poseidoniales archaeon]
MNHHGDWIAEQGHTHPEKLIDHNGDLDTAEAFFGMFSAYNQHHIKAGTSWDTWPDWEVCLTSLDSELHFLEETNDEEKTEMKHWLALSQFIHNSPHVRMDGYTIEVEGNHGTTFSFDLSLDLRCWTAPGDMATHAAMLKAGTRPTSWMRRNGGNGTMVYASKFTIGHSLGSWWYVPDHVPYIGGRATDHTADETFCMEPNHASLPLAMTALVHACIDDTAIWLMLAKKDIHDQVRREWWEANWSTGVPEDIDCQYSKADWVEIRAAWKKEAENRINQAWGGEK